MPFQKFLLFVSILSVIASLIAACTGDSEDPPAPLPLTVTFTGEGGGTITLATPDGEKTVYSQSFTASFERDQSLELTATADDDALFTGWDGDCSSASGASCQLVMDAGKEARVSFAKTFILSLNLSGTGTGKIQVLNNAAELALCEDTCEIAVIAGTSLTLKALADSGATFTGWNNTCSSTTSTCSITLDSSKTVSAMFDIPEPVFHTLSVSKAGGGSGKVVSNPVGIDCGTDCEGDFLTNTTVVLSASANLGSVFAGWQNCPLPSGDSCSTTLNSDVQVVALFDLDSSAAKKIIIPIRSASDDAEQYRSAVNRVPREKGPEPYEDFPANAVDIKSGDIDLTYNTDYVDTEQLIGLRFTDLDIPPGATITDARIQFTIDHATSGYVKLYIYGQEDPQATTFVHQGINNISDRPRTSAALVWEPPDWTGKEGTRNDPAALTVNLAPIVQEIVDLPGWQQGSNGLVFIIEGDLANGTNRRRATSFEDSDTESQLIVTYYD